MNNDPHRDQPVLRAGVPLEKASGAIVFLHGRGSTAEDIMGLSEELSYPQLAYLAPQAASRSWYPNSFLAPVPQNEPWLTSALNKVAATIELITAAGVSADHVIVCGFSQGACLATEFVARHPARYAGLIAFTGGLIGPPGADLSHAGDLEGTPVFFGSGDPDPHVPWNRVAESASILKGMNGAVTARRYAGMSHTIGRDELEFAKGLIQEAFQT